MSKIASVFPGQGSQSIGMGKELFENFSVYKETVEEASDSTGVDFKKLCFEGPEEDLRLTENTQPAIVTCSVGAFRVLKNEFGFSPDAVAGHSVGEYSALVAAEVISFADAVKGVKLRGKSMQEAVPVGEGAMAALLGPSDEQVVELCKWVESQNVAWTCEAANFNCPGQVVVSGSNPAIEWLKENISNFAFDPKPKRVRFIPLKVSAPFHCKLMKPAEEKMETYLNSISFSTPICDLIQNITAKKVSDVEQIKTNIVNQVSGSVLWTKSISFMQESGVSSYIETGSGETLAGLIKKIDKDSPSLFSSSNLENLKTFETFLKN